MTGTYLSGVRSDKDFKIRPFKDESKRAMKNCKDGKMWAGKCILKVCAATFDFEVKYHDLTLTTSGDITFTDAKFSAGSYIGAFHWDQAYTGDHQPTGV